MIQIPYPKPGSVINNIFLRSKKDGSWRMILNLKPLNKFIVDKPFKMEHIEVLQEMVQPGMYATSLDISDAFFHVPLNRRHWKYMTFRCQEKYYMFTCLPMGCKISPYVFAKITRVLLAHCRARGILLLFYIDDIVILAATCEVCTKHTEYVKNLLIQAGFIINFKKSNFIPSQQFEALGFLLDSCQMTVSLTLQKVNNYTSFLQRMLDQTTITIHQVTRIVGIFISLFPVVPLGKTMYRKLERFKNMCLLIHKFKWSTAVTLPPLLVQDINWWLDRIKLNAPYSFVVPPVNLRATSDASSYAWSFCLDNGDVASSRFHKDHTEFSINTKELLAIYWGLLPFRSKLHHTHIQVSSDNTTCIADIKKCGSMCSEF